MRVGWKSTDFHPTPHPLKYLAGKNYFSVLGNREVVHGRIPSELNVAHLGGPCTVGVRVPSRDNRHVLEEQLFSLVLKVECLGTRSRQRVAQVLVKLTALPTGVVGGSVRRVGREEEVVERGVVTLPALTESTLSGASLHIAKQRLEVCVGIAFSLKTQGVLDGVAGCGNPLLVATSRVVGDEELAAPRRDRVSLRPQLLSLGGVVLQNLRALQAFLVTVNCGGSEVLGGGTGAREDRLDDRVTIDRH